MLKMQNVSKIYRTDLIETYALRSFSLEVGAGEFVAVTGPSGSGKTTFLNVAGLLEEPSTPAATSSMAPTCTGFRDDARSRLRNEQHRLHLPELQPDPRPQHPRQRRGAAALPRA